VSFDPTSTLWRVSPSTDDLVGPVRTVFGAGVELTDVAIAPDGTVYATSFTTLYRLDRATAVATPVGAIGLSDINSLAARNDGTLFASSVGGRLYNLSTATGAATLIGGLGAASSGDLVFGPTGTLYVTVHDITQDFLASVNTTTGQATRIGSGLNIANVYGLFNAGGQLYGLSYGSTIQCSQGAVLVVDPAAGVARIFRCASFRPGGAANP
jgi:hypothetical protein